MNFNTYDLLNHFIILTEKKKTFKEFKDYIINNNIHLKDLKDTKGDKVDILMKCIENKSSQEIIEYVIVNGQYETLNYKICNKVIVYFKNQDKYLIDYYHEENKEDTPLSLAIRNNDFVVADLLIEYGADILFIPCEIVGDILNKKNSLYILRNGYPLSESLVRETIWNKKWFIKQYHQYHIFNNSFILKLLIWYKKKPQISTFQIEDEVNRELTKISYDELIYYWPFKSDQYDILKIFYEYDSRPKEEIHSIIFKLLSQHYLRDKTENFLRIIKNNEYDLYFEPNFIQQIENLILQQHHYKKKNIENLIEMNDIIHLKQYIKENDIHLKDFNKKYDKYDDMLRLAIKYNGSIEMIKFIIKECCYDNFNYNVISPEATSTVSLLFFTLSLTQYKTFNFLIEKGADIYFGDVMSYIIKKRLIKIEHIKYILDYNIELNESILDKVIEKDKTDLLILILKRYSFNRYFILKLLYFYKNKTPQSRQEWPLLILKEKDKQNFLCKNGYKYSKYNEKLNTINIIYENDTRDQDCIFKELFQLFGNEIKWNDSMLKNKFINEIKKKTLKINVDQNYLNNLYYCGEKREKMMELIKNNNLIELKSYINRNKVVIEYFFQPIFDLLIFAIENLEDTKESLDMILFLTQQYHSLNYSIHEMKNDKYKSPLSCAISMNKFSFAKLLLGHGAKINENIFDSTDILSLIYNDGNLNQKNLNFILKNNFIRISSQIIKNWIKTFKNDFIKMTVNCYLYDNNIILNYLSFYRNKTTLSFKKFNQIVEFNKTILKLDYDWFYEAISNENEGALKILFKYYGNYYHIYNEEISNLKDLITIASENNNKLFFDQLLSNHLFSFEKNITFEDLMSITVKYSHFDLVQYLITNAFHHKTFNVEIINIKKIIIDLVGMDNESIIDIFIHELLNCDKFLMNNTSLKEIILPLFELNNDELTKTRIDYILNHEKFSFKKGIGIEIEKCLLLTLKIMDPIIRKYFIEKIILHPSIEFHVDVIERILLILNKIKDEDNSIIPLVIKTMTTCQKLNYDIYNRNCIDINKILLFSIKYNNIKITNYLFTEFIQPNENYKYIDYLEKPLLISSKIDNVKAMMFLLEKLFKIISDKNKKKDSIIDNNYNDNCNQNSFDFSLLKDTDTPYFSLILNVLIKVQNYQQVKYLVESKDYTNILNINCKDKNDEYPVFVVYDKSKYDDNKFKLLKYFLNIGIDCSSVRNVNKKSLLTLAIEEKNYRVINELFKHNIPLDFDMNIINESLTRKAVYNNQLEEVKSLIKINRKSIFSKMKTLLNNNGKKINNSNIQEQLSMNHPYYTILSISYLLNRTEIFEYLLNGSNINDIDFHGYSILHYAILREDVNTIRKLIKLGVDVNYYNKYIRNPSSIEISLYIKNKNIALDIINNKNMMCSSINTINEMGETLILTLLRLNAYELIDKIDLMKNLLCRESIDLNISDKYGNLALDYAIKENSLDMIKILVDHGACLKKSLHKNQKEILKYAIANDDSEIIQYLIHKDFTIITDDIIKEVIFKNRIDILKIIVSNYNDINKIDENNHTILYYANEHHNEEIIKYLTEHGAIVV